MDSGVKVVGAQASDDDEPGQPKSESESAAPARRSGDRRPAVRLSRRRFTVLCALTVAGLVGTAVFGIMWGSSGGSSGPSDGPVISAADAFLTDLTNFNADSIDADFGHITAMATGTFSGQANQFFNSAIRQDLEKALAESRGQIRNVYVQSLSGGQAAVYAVVDQEYANNKITAPQTDVLRVVVNLTLVKSVWKISDVTVLEGATPVSGSSPSGSAGSAVPGQ
jgi:hypothetical protein